VLLTSSWSAGQTPLVTGLKNPESVAVGPGGRVYVTVIGEFNKDGDGAVMMIDKGKAVPFAAELNDPKGIVHFGNNLYVTDKDRVLRVDAKGQVTVLAGPDAFPAKPVFLNDIAADEGGMLYVSDSGDFKGGGAAIYRVPPKGKVTLVADSKKTSALKAPNGLLHDSQQHLLVLDAASGELHRLTIATGAIEKLADGFGGGDGLCWDRHGRLFISDWQNGKVFVIPRPGEKPIQLASGFQSAADICLSADDKHILVPDMKAGTLTAVPIKIPGWEVDETPLPLAPAVAFPDLKWAGWDPEDKSGKIVPLRPILLTHAGDGSNRVFVPTQRGVIHVFPNDQKAKETKVFLDISSKVLYTDNENEQGFLGLAFHPRYKENGEFFVFYSDKKAKLENVISRFKVSKDDPNRTDPASEEELLRIKRPYWNHDGGTICFGPDGYLYIALGDGGAANDPQGHGQNMKSILGKVLRIDISTREDGKKYGIPKDNPFVGKPNVAPEIWASGLRNIWRMAFDRQTGQLWAGEVGQNLWEEINIITKGGNYGWNPRESLHPLGVKGVGPRPEYIEPLWEYHHDIGKSITGGHVYRGSRLPELEGLYLYADYVTARIWALKYDQDKKRVVVNRPIPHKGHPVLSFGEDEKGEVYYLIATPSGRGIWWFEKTEKK
jgi:glucose/arabinose dehydrogenase